MSDQERFTDLFERAGSSNQSLGKYEAQLSAETRELLDEFTIWLHEVDSKSEATSRSYKSYVAKAMAEPQSKLTSDQKSGVRAFSRFLSVFHPEFLED